MGAVVEGGGPVCVGGAVVDYGSCVKVLHSSMERWDKVDWTDVFE